MWQDPSALRIHHKYSIHVVPLKDLLIISPKLNRNWRKTNAKFTDKFDVQLTPLAQQSITWTTAVNRVLISQM